MFLGFQVWSVEMFCHCGHLSRAAESFAIPFSKPRKNSFDRLSNLQGKVQLQWEHFSTFKEMKLKHVALTRIRLSEEKGEKGDVARTLLIRGEVTTARVTICGFLRRRKSRGGTIPQKQEL